MKRFLVFVAMMVMVLGVAIHGGEGKFIRLNGTSTTATNTYTITCDSTDTFGVDTIPSDTFKFEDYPDFWDYNYLHVMLIRDTVVLCDSCNDSVVVATNIWTKDNNGYKFLLATDAPAADLTNDTCLLRFYIQGNSQVPYPDSTVRDWIWIETIVSDSVITDKAVTGTGYKARYFFWFSE